ncbi:hypothetical protein F5J12DRAFT_787756 [Pisolithus orientalis]|uniref:uncharacterized protein n=1 Tax=Pisolithus orientalis TaxID=936130 RepID=UPI0022254CDB|nr:uncharacterized protein F5J12DRAFT_787756 [Pisolithus orientalis]KAI5983692.1 hypothetical protein F5J12DRAFT_787756 [Pisolithus orientalis]
MSLYDTADHSTVCDIADGGNHSVYPTKIPLPLVQCKKRIQPQMPDAWHHSGNKRNVRKGFNLRFQMLSINLATSLPNQDYPSSSKMLEKDSTPDARCLASIWPPGEVEHRTNSVHPTKITPPPVQCKKRIMPQMEDAWHQSGHQMKWSTMTTRMMMAMPPPHT